MKPPSKFVLYLYYQQLSIKIMLIQSWLHKEFQHTADAADANHHLTFIQYNDDKFKI